MDKKYFALKLIASRPTFAQDMTDAERVIMQQHVVYWMQLMEKGKVIVFGPVFDPAGAYGFGVVEAESEEEVRSFIANDPATQLNRYEFYPMRAVLPKK